MPTLYPPPISPEAPKPARLHHFDALRGLAMLMVVFGHTQLTYGQISFERIRQIFAIVQMPIFFVLSGYMLYSAIIDRKKLIKKSIHRPLTILWPTLLLLLLYIFCFSCPPWELPMREPTFQKLYASLPNSEYHRLVYYIRGAVTAPYKLGYWFTFVLAALYFALAPLIYIFSKYRVPNMWRVALLLLVVLAYKVALVKVLSPHGLITNIFSLELIDHSLIYLVFGMIAKIYQPQFTRLYQKHSTGVITLGCFILGLFVLFVCGLNPYDLVKIFISVAATIGLCYFFYWVMQAKPVLLQRPLSWLTIVGTSTLEIYLIHYFLLSTLASTPVHTFVSHYILGTPFQHLYLLLTPLLIVYVCLLIVTLLKRLRLHPLLFPQ